MTVGQGWSGIEGSGPTDTKGSTAAKAGEAQHGQEAQRGEQSSGGASSSQSREQSWEQLCSGTKADAPVSCPARITRKSPRRILITSSTPSGLGGSPCEDTASPTRGQYSVSIAVAATPLRPLGKAYA